MFEYTYKTPVVPNSPVCLRGAARPATPEGAVKDSLTTAAADGKKYRVKHYNLDVIISVGYRVKSLRGTHFRQWATGVLRHYLVQGYALNEKRLRESARQLADLKRLVQLQGEVATRQPHQPKQLARPGYLRQAVRSSESSSAR